MPYTISWSASGSYVVFTGKINIDDINQANNDYYGDPRFDEIKYQIFDLSKADTSGITLEDIKYPAAFDNAATNYKNNFKAAMICADSHCQSLCNEYIKLAENYQSPWVFSVFDCYQKARVWCELET